MGPYLDMGLIDAASLRVIDRILPLTLLFEDAGITWKSCCFVPDLDQELGIDPFFSQCTVTASTLPCRHRN